MQIFENIFEQKIERSKKGIEKLLDAVKDEKVIQRVSLKKKISLEKDLKQSTIMDTNFCFKKSNLTG